MACPDCASTATTRRKGRTALGYRRFRCQACRRRFNERTGTPFNDLQYPTDIVLLAVLWRLRYKLGFRDVAELLLQRGFESSTPTTSSSKPSKRPRSVRSARSQSKTSTARPPRRNRHAAPHPACASAIGCQLAELGSAIWVYG